LVAGTGALGSKRDSTMPTSVARKRFRVAGPQPMELPPVMVCMPDLPDSPASGSNVGPKAMGREEVAESAPGSFRTEAAAGPETAVMQRPRGQRWRRPDTTIWNHWLTKTGVGAVLLLVLILLFFVSGRNNAGDPTASVHDPAAAETAASPARPEPLPQPAAEETVPPEKSSLRPARGVRQTPSSQGSPSGAPTTAGAATPDVSKPADPAAQAGEPKRRKKPRKAPADKGTAATTPQVPKAPQVGPALTAPVAPDAGEPPQGDLAGHPFPPAPSIVGAEQPGSSETPPPSPPASGTPFGTDSRPAESEASPDDRATAGGDGVSMPAGTPTAPPDESGFPRPPFSEVPSPREEQRRYPTTGLEERTATWPGPRVDRWRGGPQDGTGDQRVSQRPALSPYPTTSTPEPHGLTDRRWGPHGPSADAPAMEAAGQSRDSPFGGAGAAAASSPYPMTDTPSLDYLKSRVASDQPTLRTSMRQPPAGAASTAPAGVAPRPGEAQLRGFIEPPPLRPRYE
jgi:hypothetical protein